RHTRSKRDWSSDVCSSDLVLPGGATNILARALGLPLDPVEAAGIRMANALDDEAFKLNLGRADGRYFAVNCGAGVDAAAMDRLRSEERRVGKESGSQCAAE